MTEIEFVEELPAEGVTVDKYKSRAWGFDIAPQLRARPGVWALLQTGTVNTSSIYNRRISINRGKTAPWKPEGDFEAALLRIGGGTLSLYARYTGGAK